MSIPGYLEQVHASCDEEGVVIEWSESAVRMSLPHPKSARHQLRIISAVWQAWTTVRGSLKSTDTACIVDVPAPSCLSRPLVNVLAVLDSELRLSGNRLLVVQPGMPWSVPLALLTRDNKNSTPLVCTHIEN